VKLSTSLDAAETTTAEFPLRDGQDGCGLISRLGLAGKETIGIEEGSRSISFKIYRVIFFFFSSSPMVVGEILNIMQWILLRNGK
jgi:hypothetical protein